MHKKEIENLLRNALEELPTTKTEWRISDMAERSKKMKCAFARKAAACAATASLVLLSGNALCYAMTGNSLIKEMETFYLDLTKDNVMINNDVLSGQVKESYEEESGMMHYEFLDGNKTSLRMEHPERSSVFEYMAETEEGNTGGIIIFEGILFEQNDRIYLDLYGEPIDVTEDLKDGIVTGSFVYKGSGIHEINETFSYRVEGSLENYTVDVWWMEN